MTTKNNGTKTTKAVKATKATTKKAAKVTALPKLAIVKTTLAGKAVAAVAPKKAAKKRADVVPVKAAKPAVVQSSKPSATYKYKGAHAAALKAWETRRANNPNIGTEAAKKAWATRRAGK